MRIYIIIAVCLLILQVGMVWGQDRADHTAAQFTFTAEPLHPRWHNAYNAGEHRYRDSYLEKDSWNVQLNACQNLDEEFVGFETGPRGKPHKITKPDIPDNVQYYAWNIRKIDGDFHRRMRGARMCQTEFTAPSLGLYRITLTVRLTSGAKFETTQHVNLRRFRIVSLGDSFSAGQGNPDARGFPKDVVGETQCSWTTFSKAIYDQPFTIWMDNDAEWQEPEAYRSYDSGPSLAAESLEDDSTMIQFLTFASSGATVQEGMIYSQRNWQKWGQVAEARQTLGPSKPIDALVISIGGNDVGFAWSLEKLTKEKVTLTIGLADKEFGKTAEEVMAQARANLRQLRGDLEELESTISRLLNVRQVYLTEYPTGLFDGDSGRPQEGCGLFNTAETFQISQADARRMEAFGRELNETLRSAANEFGWIYVDGIDEGFEGHGYCSSDPYFVRAEESCRKQGDFMGTMHPNEEGHRVYKQQLMSAIQEHTIRPVIERTAEPPVQEPQEPVTESPPEPQPEPETSPEKPDSLQEKLEDIREKIKEKKRPRDPTMDR